MNADIGKVLSSLENKLLTNEDIPISELHSAYSLATKLRSLLIGAIYEKEYESASELSSPKLAELMTEGKIANYTVFLTIDEPLPPLKELTSAMNDYWLELIHTAIKKAAYGQKPLYFKKAFVLIEITTPKYSDNTKLWDTSNCAINLIINNLKGIFFEDDNLEHMAFGVIGSWGETGKTVVKIMPFEQFLLNF